MGRRNKTPITRYCFYYVCVMAHVVVDNEWWVFCRLLVEGGNMLPEYEDEEEPVKVELCCTHCRKEIRMYRRLLYLWMKDYALCSCRFNRRLGYVHL